MSGSAPPGPAVDEILVNAGPGTTRVAVLAGNALVDLYVEAGGRRGLVGNVYRGKVGRVLPGMQAAFVDLGLARTGFLHADDVARPPDAGSKPAIRELLHEGDPVLVQVLKDPVGTKGARLTTAITLPSRYLVLLPGDATVGISARITDPAERERLRDILAPLVAVTGHGGIVRTAAAGVLAAELAGDYEFLAALWAGIGQAADVTPPALVHADLPLAARVLRELRVPATARVLVDDELAAAGLRDFAARFVPDLAGRIEHVPGPRPLFDRHGLEDEMARLLKPTVELRSGGYLVIESTEAMTTVDVNTGAYVGHHDQEETILRTNLEAATAVARQLRLRNIGGIVVVDFIDLQSVAHRRQVLATLADALASDPTRPQLADIDALGLVALTRKRTRDSLAHALLRPCPACGGTGRIKSADSVCEEIVRAVRRLLPAPDARELVILASRDVADRLQEAGADLLTALERAGAPPVRLQPEAQYAPDQFDLVVV